MNLGRLRALCEVADRGTIAAAAQALHLTPSAVSQQISALERELGERLLEPEGRGVRLTSIARVLVRRADRLFAEHESLRAELARHADGGWADLRVGGFATAIARVIAPAARALRDQAPGVRLEVIEADGEKAFAQLWRHELDVVVSMEAPGAPTEGDPRVARSSLCADPLLAALPADHELATAGEVPLRALAREAWVMPPRGWLCEQVILAGCQAAGFTPEVVHRAGDWGAILALCGAGLGVGMVPALAQLEDRDGAVIRPIADPAPRRHIFAACRRGAEGMTSIAALIETMQRVAARPGALLAAAT
jgi:DNA-binding transcriptional LysR family regulator